MIWNVGDNIVSPLGWTSEENWVAVANGKSGLQFHNDLFQLPEPFFGACLDERILDEKFEQYSHNQRFTKCEKMSILSVKDAVDRAAIDASAKDVVFVISTTKGNVELLEDLSGFEKDRPYLWRMAQVIAQYFGNANEPVVVSNACISGCAAQIVADRLLASGRYRYAIVLGVDRLSKFVVSGFQSFKALSPELCRPFDAERIGLNLGEAAATIVYSAEPRDQALAFVSGALCNDANHISAPSRTAEGLVKAIQQTFDKIEDFDIQQIAFVSAHGTATRYNDDMESVALQRMALQSVPVNSLKGYFGHTLGAAGVLETIISGHELSEGKILPTRGCQEPGTVSQISVIQQNTKTDKHSFLKIISGFGGSNAVAFYTKNATAFSNFTATKRETAHRVLSRVVISNRQVEQDGNVLYENDDCDAKHWLINVYKQLGVDYPKFFKMDCLCKSGFLASELLVRKLGNTSPDGYRSGAVVVFNSAGSLDDDRAYEETIRSADNFFPSPSIFVYTLSNIVTGEMAIRHKIQGESSCYIARKFCQEDLENAVNEVFANSSARFVLGGWCDYDEEICDVRMCLFELGETE